MRFARPNSQKNKLKALYSIFKPLIFLISPEKAHHITVSLWKFILAIPLLSSIVRKNLRVESKSLEKELFGLKFSNPVGLAAGFDKDGKYYHPMAQLGFGFVEIGTVTPLGQDGNPQPRLFRLPKDKGLINRMGFNNEGVDALVERLKKQENQKRNYIIGGNIGKNKITPNEKAVDDYVICFEKLFAYVDYFVVNVSSPNTPNLRDLQDKEPLTHLLNTLQKLNNQKESRKPILLKIAPDLTSSQLDDIIEIIASTKIDGIIATNTTISRDGLNTSSELINSIGAGGLSGTPVKERSTEIIKYLHTKSGGSFPIVGVGGIDSPEAAKAKLNAGASLIQIYSGMVYYGPTIVRDINRSILK